MANNSIYTSITEETVTGARNRVLQQLDELTNGMAETAIRYVSEFVELDNILEEHKKRKAEEEKTVASGIERLKEAFKPEI